MVCRSSESCVCWVRGRKGLMLSIASCFNRAASHFIWPSLTFRGRDTLPHQNKLPLTSQRRGSARPWGCSGHRLWAARELQYIIHQYMCVCLCVRYAGNQCIVYSFIRQYQCILGSTQQFQVLLLCCPRVISRSFWRFYSVASCRKPLGVKHKRNWCQ